MITEMLALLLLFLLIFTQIIVTNRDKVAPQRQHELFQIVTKTPPSTNLNMYSSSFEYKMKADRGFLKKHISGGYQ